MPHRSRWRPSRITLLSGLVLACMVTAGTGYALWRDHHARLTQADLQQTLLARVVEEHATRGLDATRAALEQLAQATTRRTPHTELHALMEQTRASLHFVQGLALLDDHGRVLTAVGSAATGPQVPALAMAAWREAGPQAIGRFVARTSLAASTSPSTSPSTTPGTEPSALTSPSPGYLPVLQALPADPAGQHHTPALLVAMVNPEALASLHELTANDTRAAGALVEYGGRLLARTPDVPVRPGTLLPGLTAGHPALTQDPAVAALEGRWDGTGLRPGPQFMRFRHLPGRPLHVLVELPRNSLHEQTWQAVREQGLPALAIAAALLSLTAVASAALRSRERSLAQLDTVLGQVVAREQELSAIFGTVQDLLFRTDAAGRVTLINEGYARLSGEPVAQVIGQPLEAVFGGAPNVAALFLPQQHATVQPRQTRADWVTAGGRLRSFEISVVPLYRQPDHLEWVGSATDVSALVHAQAELRAQLGLARSLLASSPLPMSVLDTFNRYLDVNRAWEQFTGRQRADVLGRQACSDLPPDEVARDRERDAELLARGGELTYETVWRGRDGRPRDLRVSKSTFPDAQGRPMGLVVCFMDISEFREADRAARAARDAALGASQAKSEFIANVSHELRTPLQAILGFAELGSRRTKEQPRVGELFSDVHRAGQRMLSLVNDLLDLAKIERGQEPIHPQPLDLRPLALEVVRELTPLFSARDLMLDAQLGGDDLGVMADPLRLQQLLRNLLANAIRFSPVGGRVELAAGLDDAGDVRLTVSDQGPGIPPDELERVFEAFVQSSGPHDAAGGTGLGLAICRRLAQAHGGRIWAANRPGGGAVLTLVLPALPREDSRPARL
ncbi:ATP-binding protein [Pelomonas baiyunensis]|uniref:histidine kinase n=1 Tax=Pelomonas baiyunensis TaxID=3299026 RepID=A0ABW7H053_9BURK